MGRALVLTAEEQHQRKLGWQRTYRNRHKERLLIEAVCRDHHISVEQYHQLRKEHQYCCAICGLSEDQSLYGKLQIDHDHKCCSSDISCGQCIRGLLCHKCNKALGLFKDNPELLKKAVVYVL
jgi:Recombination endonuclease VII